MMINSPLDSLRRSSATIEDRILWERHIACRELRRRRVRLPDNEEQLDRAIALAYVSFFLLLAAAPEPGRKH